MNKCPECGNEYDGEGSLSRIDNETVICDECGFRESIDDMHNHMFKQSKFTGEQMTEIIKTCCSEALKCTATDLIQKVKKVKEKYDTPEVHKFFNEVMEVFETHDYNIKLEFNITE